MSHCAYCLLENKFIDLWIYRFIDFYYNYKKRLVGWLVGWLVYLYIASFFFASFSDRGWVCGPNILGLLRLLGLQVYSSLRDICIPILGILSPNMLQGLFRIRLELKEGMLLVRVYRMSRVRVQAFRETSVAYLCTVEEDTSRRTLPLQENTDTDTDSQDDECAAMLEQIQGSLVAGGIARDRHDDRANILASAFRFALLRLRLQVLRFSFSVVYSPVQQCKIIRVPVRAGSLSFVVLLLIRESFLHTSMVGVRYVLTFDDSVKLSLCCFGSLLSIFSNYSVSIFR